MSYDPDAITNDTNVVYKYHNNDIPEPPRRSYGYYVCPTHATLYRTPGDTLYFRLEPRTEIRRVSHKPSAHKLDPRRRSHHRQIKRTLNRSAFITANKI